jgi:outer membrane protein, multidrug efflux system
MKYPLILLFIAALTSCTVTPQHRKTEVSVPPSWSSDPGKRATTPVADLSEWWTSFEDAELNALISQAEETNLDLREAEARIRETRALRRVTAADAWPLLNGSGSYTRSRFSENSISSTSEFLDGDIIGTPDDSGNAGANGDTDTGQSRGFGGFSGDRNSFRVGFDASWEIDLFGHVHWAVEAAEADIAAARENRRDVLVSVLAEVARNYTEMRGAQRRPTVARENLIAQQEIVEITQDRFAAGLTSALDSAQANALLATTQSQLPILESTTAQIIHRLGVLVGRPPGALFEELSPTGPIPFAAADIIIGLPSDLLRRRPDIRRAERELEATIARIGVATADLFPRFSLTGALGLQSVEFTDLARTSSLFWSTGPSMRWSIFAAGRIRANIRVQNERQEHALARYEKTVLTALEEVENTLVSYTRELERRHLLSKAVTANREAVALASERYTAGVEDFLTVLEAQRSLYTAEDQLAQSELAVTVNLIALYKALGGGWELDTEVR